MRMVFLVVVILLVTSVWATADSFTTICDFDKTDRPWSVEPGSSPVYRTKEIKAHSGSVSMGVKIARTGRLLRATWGCSLSDVIMTPDSRIKVFIHGNKLCKTSTGQPHGGILLIESGGGSNGTDSMWMIDIPGEIYAKDAWTEFLSLPISQAKLAGWSEDSNGKLDVDKVQRVLFVSQQEDDSIKLPEYVIHIDDLAISNCSMRSLVSTPAQNSSVPVAIRPVQRGFIGRKRDAGQQLLFNDLTGWTIQNYPGAEASFVKSEEEPLFGQPVGKLTYRANGAPGYFRLKPPKPIELQKFNGILMWMFGNVWSWTPDPNTPQVLVSLVIQDAKGETHTIELDPVNWKFWSVMHKCVKQNVFEDERHSAYGGDSNWKLDFPAKLIAIDISNGTNKDFRSVYIDSIIFRNEKPNPPKYTAKLDKLPFPTSPNSYRPSVNDPVINTVRKSGSTYIFSAKAGSDVTEFRYTPKSGTLSDLVFKAGDITFKPVNEGGPRHDMSRIPKVKLKSIALTNSGVLDTVWRTELGVEYGLSLSITGKSMVVDWSSKSRKFAGLNPGTAEGLTDFKKFYVPYLTLGWGVPSIIWNKGYYLFTMVDFHYSNAAQITGESKWLSATSATCVGQINYEKLTDGTRNMLRERQYVTVSKNFEEVLPSIPNPPSPLTSIIGTNLYCHVGAIEIDRFKKSLERWKQFKEYGIDHVRVSHHEDSFSDGDTVGQGAQEYTMTLQAAPEIGDQQLISYCAEVKKLGYLIGLYTNYTDYNPLGASWDERNVAKLPNGEWERSWPPTFSLKPLKAVDMEAYYAHRVAEKFGCNTTYCDVHTCLPPMAFVDYEAGTPGAGMERTQIKAYGALLLHGRESYGGPIFSEGTHHWIYAGLDDGNYAQMGLPDGANQPLLLDFDLRKIHPLQANISMIPGWTWGSEKMQCMTEQIAYGHIGFLPFDNLNDAIQCYYMMQQLQSMYTQVPVDKILYYSADGKSCDISAAIPTGVNENRQAYVGYTNGMQIYVNCNKTNPFTVNVEGTQYKLPSFGWVAWNKGFLEYSAEFDGRRVNYVDSPVYTYLETGGRPHMETGLGTSGTIILRKDDPRGLKLIPVSAESAEIAGPYTSADAYKADGTLIGPADAHAVDGTLAIDFSDGARYYIIK